MMLACHGWCNCTGRPVAVASSSYAAVPLCAECAARIHEGPPFYWTLTTGDAAAPLLRDMAKALARALVGEHADEIPDVVIKSFGDDSN